MRHFLGFNDVTTETASPADRMLKLLIALFIIDLLVLGAHFYNSFIPDDRWNSFLALANDDSLGELLQYFKWFLISVIFVVIGLKRSSVSYFSWALVFLYLLLDDWLGIHENMGALIASNMEGLNLALPGGLRLQDIGELTVSAIAGSILLLIAIWAYANGSSFYKIITQSMFYLFLALVFFGVFIDVVAVMLYTGKVSAFLFDVVEDGGEMFVASLMLWYAVLILNAKVLPITFLTSVRSVVKPI